MSEKTPKQFRFEPTKNEQPPPEGDDFDFELDPDKSPSTPKSPEETKTATMAEDELIIKPAENEQTIETVVQDMAKKRTIIYPEALMSLIRRLKKEENK